MMGRRGGPGGSLMLWFGFFVVLARSERSAWIVTHVKRRSSVQVKKSIFYVGFELLRNEEGKGFVACDLLGGTRLYRHMNPQI